MNDLKITGIDVTLCETRVKGNFADSTRNVETIGFAVVDVSTDQGLHGIGVTYHEVGGEAIRDFIKYAIEPKMIGRSPFETEVLYEENFHYMRGVGRKGLAFCAYSAVDIALWDLRARLWVCLCSVCLAAPIRKYRFTRPADGPAIPQRNW